jgi:hypothetical protein
VRAIASAFVVCCLSAGAWAQARAASKPANPPTPAATRAFAWNIPGVVEKVEVQGKLATAGIPVEAEAVRSHAKPQEILEAAVRSFHDAGFYLPPADEQVAPPGAVMVTALDAQHWTSYSVTLERGPGSDTTVILSRAFLGKREPPGTDFAPVVPGAVEVARANVEAAQTLTFVVLDPKVDVPGFYREQLARAGYRELSPGTFQGPEDRIELYLHPEPGHVHVTLVHRRVVEGVQKQASSP